MCTSAAGVASCNSAVETLPVANLRLLPFPESLGDLFREYRRQRAVIGFDTG